MMLARQIVERVLQQCRDLSERNMIPLILIVSPDIYSTLHDETVEQMLPALKQQFPGVGEDQLRSQVMLNQMNTIFGLLNVVIDTQSACENIYVRAGGVPPLFIPSGGNLVN